MIPITTSSSISVNPLRMTTMRLYTHTPYPYKKIFNFGRGRENAYQLSRKSEISTGIMP